MKFRQVSLLLIGLILLGAPVIGEADTGTPVSVTPSPVWESVIVTDAEEKNQKTRFYTTKPLGEKRIGNGRLTEFYAGILPDGVREELRYSQYPVAKEYVMRISGGSVPIKAQPRFGSKTVKKAGRFEAIATDGIVHGEYAKTSDSSKWYRVNWGTAEAPREGYIFAPEVTRRGFQFRKMAEALNRLKDTVENASIAHVDNYKNRSGWAPTHTGQTVDDFGVHRDQAAPAYFSADRQSDFRYLPDGSLVSILGERGEFYEISAVDFSGIYYIPKKYLPSEPRLMALNKVVIVDRKNQNEAVFEGEGKGWKLISYVMATTGEKAEFKEETSLGNFMVIEKKSKFMYLGDVSKEIEGYAPYAIRFNGGAYVHGVPVNYKEIKSTVVVKAAVLDPLGNVIAPPVTREVVVGREDPGMKEYLSSIGTTPRSHKCVRNYTSHAKFLYDWTEIGFTAVIVIE